MTKTKQEVSRPNAAKTDDEVLKKVLAVTNQVNPPVYAPSEDSLLMIEAIKDLPLRGMKMLDMGTGSGILALYSAMRGADVTASDIDPAAISEARNAARLLGMSMTFCLSDLFTDVPGKFDLVLFNPPYLPSASFDDKSVDGGPNGTLITNRFLKDLPAHLEKRAHGFLILTSLNDPDSIRERHSNLRFSVVAKRSLFFEELRVLRVGLRNDLAVQ